MQAILFREAIPELLLGILLVCGQGEVREGYAIYHTFICYIKCLGVDCDNFLPTKMILSVQFWIIVQGPYIAHKKERGFSLF